MTLFAQLITRINTFMNILFSLLRRPMEVLPAWFSLTVISVMLGILLLLLFKYTSNQNTISRVRDKIKADLLAMKLFRDNLFVVLKCQLNIFFSALLLLVYSTPSVIIMAFPFCLILGQLGVWYQVRPLKVNEEAVVIMQLSGSTNNPLPEVSLMPSDSIEITVGPVKVPSRRQVYWNIRTVHPGTHQLLFRVEDKQFRKTLSVGTGFMPVSIKRPSLSVTELILFPAEKPFTKTSPVRSIEIAYPHRSGPITGSDRWIISLMVLSMLSALATKRLFRVQI